MPALFRLFCIVLNMLEGKGAELGLLRLCGSSLTGVAAEDDDIEQGVAHQTVAAVDAADSLACNEAGYR